MTVGEGRKPCIFVSSTCYDLSQIRHNIKNFIENNLGYEAILSEFESFPLNPNIGTIENCLRVVNQRADLFILILGGRYGYINDSGKSITNLEYIHARAKGIPIYVFTLKSILSILPVWKNNTEGDFNAVVDSTKIFEFVNQVYSHDNVWVFPFDNAQDIINTMQIQLSYLFYDSLFYRNRIISSGLLNSSKYLFGNALKIVLEKPKAWEYLLFGEILQNGISENCNMRFDYANNINIGKTKKLSGLNDVLRWIEDKINDLRNLSETLGKLLNQTLPEAFGPDGEPGNANSIIYTAENATKIYKFLLEWALEFDAISVDDDYIKLLSNTRKFSDNVIEDIEQYAIRYNKTLKDALLQPSDENKPIHIDLSWTLRNLNNHEFTNEIEHLRNNI